MHLIGTLRRARAAACCKLGISPYVTMYVRRPGKVWSKYGLPKLIATIRLLPAISPFKTFEPDTGRAALPACPERTRPYKDAIIRSAEFAASSDLADLSREDLARIESLASTNFGVEEEPMAYKGTMQRMAS